ncbi:MAG: ABC transporter substrate-binding protein [Candidatus Lokiarchaeota archaeon]|nr:ABC transporter substrate-binding protein [Candidatus Lokiarchaeota archaeon]
MLNTNLRKLIQFKLIPWIKLAGTRNGYSSNESKVKKRLISLLTIGLIISGISNIVLFNQLINISPAPSNSIFLHATNLIPTSLDPLNASDSGSKDVIHQVCEGLFAYDLRDLNLPRINHLAEQYFWENQTTLQIKIREGINFHDGSQFNALAVKWNLDRINYFINATGNLPSNTPKAKLASLFFLPDYITPIINRTEVVKNFNITIYLNAPFSPLLNLFCHQACYMISPKSADATSYIQLDGDLVGTGPFMFNSYNKFPHWEGKIKFGEVKFTRWEGYWRNLPHFEELIFILTDEEYGIGADWYTNIAPWSWCCGEEPPETITFKLFTADTGIPDLSYYYLGLNNKIYNATWRKAMCLAINYSYVADFLKVNVISANSPISPGFIAAYNLSAQTSYNITKARTLMQSMGFGTGFTTDAEWIAVAESTSPFLSIPYTYNLGNEFREDLFTAIPEWFKLIGIEVQDDGVTWSQYINYLYYDRDHLGAFVQYMDLDCLDPYHMLNQLFNPNSDSNFAQVNDPWINTKLSLALNTSDEVSRNNIYKDIQGYITETAFYHAPLLHRKLHFIHSAKIHNPIYNVLSLFEAYYMYRV